LSLTAWWAFKFDLLHTRQALDEFENGLSGIDDAISLEFRTVIEALDAKELQSSAHVKL
jgi:hypothetical protein